MKKQAARARLPCVNIDGIYLKRGRDSSCENVAAMVAIDINDDGYREATGAAEGRAVPKECRRDFLSWLHGRGPHGVRMFAGDKPAAMIGSIAEVLSEAAYQRCMVHLYRNVLANAPKSKRPAVVVMLKAVHAMESREASEAKAAEVITKLEPMRLGGSRQGGARRIRRDAHLHEVPPHPPAQDPHQQRDREAQRGGQKENPDRGDLPRRKERPHAGDRQAQVHRRELMGFEKVF